MCDVEAKGASSAQRRYGKETVPALRSWLRERPSGPAEPLFPNAKGGGLTRDGVEYILAKHVATARRKCPTLTKKRVTAHVLRHSLAMNLLQNGIDRSVIALWLGHESVATTQMYLHADMAMKERALAKTKKTNVPFRRYRPDDRLLAFLKGL